MISVCMATYNGEKYIKQQIESILKQIGLKDELVISDDGSTDTTIEIIKNINDKRIKLFDNNGKHGFTHNFESAINNATGDYIFLSDQDDIWLDDKVAVTMQELQTCDMAISDCITVNEKLETIQESRFKAFNIKPGLFRHFIKSRYLGCCIAFNKKIKNAITPFPLDDNLLEHDIWIVAVAFMYFNVKLIYKPLILYRRHDSNTSAGGFEQGYSLVNKIYRRMYRFFWLIKINSRVRGLK